MKVMDNITILITVPCHRILGKHVALTGYCSGLDMNVASLVLEREIPNSEQ